MKAKVNGIEMFWLEEGRGRPLVFLHAFPLTGAMWGPQLVHFSRTNKVIIPDLRGFGKTSFESGKLSLMELMADDLNALLEHLKIKKAVITGLSMGGYLALAFYQKYRQKVSALVLCDTKSEADNEEAKANRQTLLEQVKEHGAVAAAEIMIPRLFSPQTYRQKQETVAQLAGLIGRNNPEGITAAALGMAERPDSTPLLAQIEVPALVISGKDDVITPVDGARKMAQAIPDWQLAVIPNAGHISNLENPTFFNQALESFLSSVNED